MDFKGPVPCPSSASWKSSTVRKDPRGSNTIALPPPRWSVSVHWEHFPSLCSAFHSGANAVSTEHCSGDLETCKDTIHIVHPSWKRKAVPPILYMTSASEFYLVVPLQTYREGRTCRKYDCGNSSKISAFYDLKINLKTTLPVRDSLGCKRSQAYFLGQTWKKSERCVTLSSHVQTFLAFRRLCEGIR